MLRNVIVQSRAKIVGEWINEFGRGAVLCFIGLERKTALLTLHEIIEYHGRNSPEELAFVFGERRTSFEEAGEVVHRIARALAARGLAPGDRIACLAKNSDRFLELLMGASAAGIVLVPLNWRLSLLELAFIIEDSEARLVFAGAGYEAAANEFGVEAILMEDAAFESWLDGESGSDPVPSKPDDIAIQLYTSGTTGNPKGVMLTHRAIMEPRRQWLEMEWYRWLPGDVALDAMPFFHVGGLGWALMSLHAGATTVILREFEPAAVVRAIEQESVTKMFLVPSALHILARHLESAASTVSSLRLIIYGASIMPADLLRKCIALFDCGFAQNYGMTETFGAITALEPSDHDPPGNAQMQSAGKALPGVEIEIQDDAGRSLTGGVVGEVVTRSRANMAGYWKLLEATKKAIDADGWLRTGDAGFLDTNGYLHIHDRLNDMIISGGENIYAAEVENAIFGHPDVEDVAVIGVPDDRWGEAVCAIVVPRAESTPTHETVTSWARLRIAAYKVPKSTILVATLPRNAAGKVLRRELRAVHGTKHQIEKKEL